MPAGQKQDEESNERTRLLKQNGSARRHESQNDETEDSNDEPEEISFDDDDEENPKNWALKWKYLNVLLVFIIGLALPMMSSIIAPALTEMGDFFGQEKQVMIAGQSGFVCMLGIGPLFFAPMSETFGRRIVFMANLVLFTLIQIPIALTEDIYSFIVLRTLSGLFGSVGVANGGGVVNDMFGSDERATVLGFYLLGPLLGPSLGPFMGGLLTSRFKWQSLFYFGIGLSAVITICAYFGLQESNAPTILEQRKKKLEEENKGKQYAVEGQSDQSLFKKIAGNSARAVKILFCQPIVLIMSAYQALVFSTMYSLYTNYSQIFSEPPHEFNQVQVAFAYLGPAAGFIATACLIVPYIDKIYKRLSESQNDGEGKPEYRLPLANIGALFLPISLFWFGWSVELKLHWAIIITSTLFFGASQVSIFNTVQNYYIDSFESQAASALAAGAFLRSMTGGIVPLIVPQMFEKLGYGWGMSVFGFISVALMPAPLLFYYYGGQLREKFKLDK